MVAEFGGENQDLGVSHQKKRRGTDFFSVLHILKCCHFDCSFFTEVEIKIAKMVIKP